MFVIELKGSFLIVTLSWRFFTCFSCSISSLRNPSLVKWDRHDVTMIQLTKFSQSCYSNQEPKTFRFVTTLGSLTCPQSPCLCLRSAPGAVTTSTVQMWLTVSHPSDALCLQIILLFQTSNFNLLLHSCSLFKLWGYSVVTWSHTNNNVAAENIFCSPEAFILSTFLLFSLHNWELVANLTTKESSIIVWCSGFATLSAASQHLAAAVGCCWFLNDVICGWGRVGSRGACS